MIWSIAPPGTRNKFHSSRVRADHEVDVRAGSGGDAIDRTRGDDVAVDHRLPRQHADHYLAAPALRVGMRDEVGLQLRLGLQAGDRPGPPRSPLGLLSTPSFSASRWPTRRAVAAEIT